MSDESPLHRFVQELQQSRGEGGAVEMLLRTLDSRESEMLRRCAIPHEFDESILRALEPALSAETAEILCVRFAQLSIVSSVGSALQLHESTRDHLFRWWLDPARRQLFREINARLATWYAGLMAEAQGLARVKAERLRIFHLIGASPGEGFSALDEALSSARSRRALNECETLVQLAREHYDILDSSLRMRLTYHRAVLEADLRHWDEAERLLRSLGDDPEFNPALGSDAAVRLGQVYRELRSWDAAITAYLRAAEIARGAGLSSHEDAALEGLASVHRQKGESEQAAAILKRVISEAEQRRDLEALATARNSLGAVFLARGESLEAIEEFERSLSIIEDLHLRFKTAQVLANLGLAWAQRSEWGRSQVFLNMALDAERERGNSYGEASVLLNIVQVEANLGHFAEACVSADTATSLFSQLHDWFHAGVAQRRKARLLRLAGEATAAVRAFDEAVSYFRLAGAESEVCATLADAEGRPGRLPWFVRVAIGIAVFGFLLLLVIIAAVIAGW